MGSGSYAVYSSVFSFCFQFCAFSYQPSAATALILLIMAAAAAKSAATQAAQQWQTFAIKRIRFNEFGSTAATRPQTDGPCPGHNSSCCPPYRWRCKNCRCLSLLFFFCLVAKPKLGKNICILVQLTMRVASQVERRKKEWERVRQVEERREKGGTA